MSKTISAVMLASSLVMGSAGVWAEGLAAAPDDGRLKEASAQVLTPKSDRVGPVGVVRQEGKVESAEALVAEVGWSCRLSLEAPLRPLPVLAK